jgi:hypothetical protein
MNSRGKKTTLPEHRDEADIFSGYQLAGSDGKNIPLFPRWTKKPSRNVHRNDPARNGARYGQIFP